MQHEVDQELYRRRLLAESESATNLLRFLKRNPTTRYTLWGIAQGLYREAYLADLSDYERSLLRASIYKTVCKLERAGELKVVSDGRQLWVQAV